MRLAIAVPGVMLRQWSGAMSRLTSISLLPLLAAACVEKSQPPDPWLTSKSPIRLANGCEQNSNHCEAYQATLVDSAATDTRRLVVRVKEAVRGAIPVGSNVHVFLVPPASRCGTLEPLAPFSLETRELTVFGRLDDGILYVKETDLRPRIPSDAIPRELETMHGY
jgi:hypothetical protein